MTKQVVKGITIGFVFVFIVNILLLMLRFGTNSFWLNRLSVNEFANFTGSAGSVVFSQISKLISYLSLVLAGLIVVRVSKTKNLLLGIILGLFITFVPILINLSILIIPIKFWIGSSKISPNLFYDAMWKNIYSQLTNSPLVVVLTTLGAWLELKLHK